MLFFVLCPISTRWQGNIEFREPFSQGNVGNAFYFGKLSDRRLPCLAVQFFSLVI